MQGNRCINCGSDYWINDGSGHVRCRLCGHSETPKKEIKPMKEPMTLNQYKIHKAIETSLAEDNFDEVTIVDYNLYDDVKDILELTDEVPPAPKTEYVGVKKEDNGEYLLVCTNDDCTSSPRSINMAKTGGIPRKFLESGCTACGNKSLKLCPR